MRWLLLAILVVVFRFACDARNNTQHKAMPYLIKRNYVITPSSYFEMKRLRRSMSSDGSCTQSPVQANVTLKGGIEAGYFRKLAQHVAMQLCIELCCEEKGCDVAFMSGKNCYGVQCFNEELCRALPAKKNVSEPVMIAHVTFKGERVRNQPPASNRLKCSSVTKKNGMTLRGGLKSGNFTDVGYVDNAGMCVKLCCVSEKCDVALTINNNCFIVSCYTKALCEMVKSLSADYKPSVAFVARKRESLNTNATSLQVLETPDNQLVCKNSQIFRNTTLKGGYKAGNYTNFGKVSNMSACVRLCCGNKDCDVALMLENNCFAVACRDSDNCSPVHAKTSSSLAALKPRISYITSRSEEVALKDELAANGSCHAGIISYDVSLKGGSNAGVFTPHGKVGSMEVCIYKCCQTEDCNVAMMLKDTCFTVACSSDEACEKKQTPTSSDFNPRIAYVFRDKSKNEKERNAKSKKKAIAPNHAKTKKKQMLAEQLHAIAKSMTPTTGSSQSQTPFMITSNHNSQSTPSYSIIEENNSHSQEGNRNRTVIHNTTYGDILNALRSMNITKETILQRFLSGNSIDSNEEDEVSEGEKSSSVKEQKDKVCTNENCHQNKTNLTIEDVIAIYKHKANQTLSKTFGPNYSGILQNIAAILKNVSTIKNTSTLQIGIDILQKESDLGEKDADVELQEDNPSLQNRTIPSLLDLRKASTPLDGESSCKSSAFLYNVTLRNGLKSGKFRDRGEMEDIKQCAKICCLLSRCDLAFMLNRKCFSVECFDNFSCDAVPARSSIFSPTICYIFGKNNANDNT